MSIAGVMREQNCVASDHDVFVALSVRCVGVVGGDSGGEEAGALGVAEIGVDKLHGGFGVGQPLAVAGGGVKGEQGALHGDGVAEIGAGYVFFAVAESAAG